MENVGHRVLAMEEDTLGIEHYGPGWAGDNGIGFLAEETSQEEGRLRFHSTKHFLLPFGLGEVDCRTS